MTYNFSPIKTVKKFTIPKLKFGLSGKETPQRFKDKRSIITNSIMANN